MQTLADLKRLSGRHRASWILDSGGPLDAQLSFIGRALPPGDRAARLAAIQQHREDYTSNFRVGDRNPELLDSIRQFTHRWAKKNLPHAASPDLDTSGFAPDHVKMVSSFPTRSSCWERSAAKGGNLGYWRDEFHRAFEGPDGEGGYAFGVENPMAFAIEESLVRLNAGQLPDHRVTALSEHGLKTRVVTVGPAWLQTLGHCVRKRLLPALTKTAGCHAPLTGATDEKMIEGLIGGHGSVLVSTDLTRATDLLPHDLVSALVDGLEASGKLTLTEVQILRVCSGP